MALTYPLARILKDTKTWLKKTVTTAYEYTLIAFLNTRVV